MEKGTRHCSIFHATAAALIILSLVGCGGKLPFIRTKSETELAVSEIKAEWLAPCAGLSVSNPDNSMEGLLSDYLALAEAMTICSTRHTSFVNYIKPVVDKERASKPSNP